MKLLYRYCLAWLLLMAARSGYGQNYTWTQMPSLATTLYSPYCFSVGTHVYMVGGIIYYGPGVTYPAHMSQAVWDFNTVTQTWARKNDFPGLSMYDGKGFTIGNYGYVVNGWDSTGSGHGSNAMWKYDPSADSWTQMTPFPGSLRYTTATFVLHGKAYVACGFSPYTNEVYCYDPTTNTWSQKHNFAGGPRQAASYFTIGNYAYVGLGEAGDGNGSYFMQSDFYRYDDVADSWTRLGDFPGDALAATQNFVVNDEGYVVNGLNQRSVYYNTSTGVNTSNKVWKYTPVSDTWSLWGVFPDSSTFDGASATCGVAGYAGFSAYNFNTFPLSRSFYRFGPSTGPYSCNLTLNKYEISNAVYNFQANGNFSPTALLTWDFGDGTYGSGTSVIHNYATVGHYTIHLSISDTSLSCSNSTADTVNVSSINNCSVVINNTNYDSLFTLSASVANGAGPYSYQWSCTSDSNFSSTSPDPLTTIGHNVTKEYCVTVTDNSGCVASACKSISDSLYQLTPCQIYIVVFPDSTIPGWYAAYIYSPTGTLNYLWDFGDGTTSTQPFPTHTYATPGRYTICLTVSDGAGCTFTFCDSSFYAFKNGGGPMSHLRVVGRTALSTEDIAADQVQIYPNPASSALNINTGGKKADEINVYNVTGQKVISISTPAQNTVHLENLPDGTYLVEVKIKDATARAKFIKLSK
ncbi:MAG: PKD domain-containing protein [Bacteroidetes bacterium]|nr:PKD domain-containing protein [Bacteroidota bacterium]